MTPALSLPTPMPMPSSAQASAMFELIFSAPLNPPVMAVTMSGNSSFLPNSQHVVSMSSASISGSALWTNLTSSQ